MISLTSLSRTLESWHLWRRRGCLNLWMKPSQHRLTTKTKHGEKTFIPNLMESMKINGVSYFIPESMYTHGFFYDAAMFRELGLEVPNTWDDLMDVCETLKENGIAPCYIGWYHRFV